MARAIDSEAAYQFLTDQLVKETGAFSRGVNKGLNIARSAMRNPDAMPTLAPPNEWVSVEKRLPREKQRVIVRCGRVGTSVGWIIWGDWMTDIGPDAGKVTHWMPLPAPPDRRPPERQEDNNETD